MKRILTGALALVLFAGAAQAQTKSDTTRFHQRQGRELVAQQLNLSADQKAKLKSIQDAQRKEMDALKAKSLNADQSKEQRKALHQKYREQMQSVLTPAQKDQMKKLQAQRKQQGGRRGQWKKGKELTRRGGEFQKELNLTQEQKNQLSKLRTDARSQMQSVRNDQSLTQDQKKEKIQLLRKDQQEKFKSVLTKEQIEKMESARKEHQARNTR